MMPSDSFTPEEKESLKGFVKKEVRRIVDSGILKAQFSPHFEAALVEANRRLNTQTTDPVMVPSLVAREMATEMIISGWTPDCESR